MIVRAEYTDAATAAVAAAAPVGLIAATMCYFYHVCT